MLCGCLRQAPTWLVYYERLVYRVCTECLNGRLDAADEFPTFEPDRVEPYVAPEN